MNSKLKEIVNNISSARVGFESTLLLSSFYWVDHRGMNSYFVLGTTCKNVIMKIIYTDDVKELLRIVVF